MAGFSFEELELDGAYLINYFHSSDNRGSFTKYFEKDIYADSKIEFKVNETFASVSDKNVIRGLHFQLHNPQAKLVCALKGRVWDVIVDLRLDSRTYKKWIGIELSKDNLRALYVPRGFAHGFVSLEDETILLYQCDGFYDKENDTGIRFDDPDIGIRWPVNIEKSIHSPRDLCLMSLKTYEERARQ